MTHPIVEVGPEMSEEERLQARRVWEANNTHEQVRGPRLHAPEPKVTMPSPEQVLLAQLMDIHPELGVWAFERFQSGDDVIAVRNRIGAIMNTAERN